MEKQEKEVFFRSGEILLEGALSTPSGTGDFPAVVICHPHPAYGGSMENNVVESLCRRLYQDLFVTLRFNFRGVGKSEGVYSNGVGEKEDVQAAILFLTSLKYVDRSRIGIVGYSAGAAFGLPDAAQDDRVSALAAISPPLAMSDFGTLKTSRKPKIFISGSEDSLVPAVRINEFCRDCVEPKECIIIKGADHFWLGYESELSGIVVKFFSRVLVSQ